MSRIQDIKRLYSALWRLRRRLGGYQSLSADPLPAISRRGGIYFFYEPGVMRSHSGTSARVVRVGKAANLRARLYAHHGAATLTGPTVVAGIPTFTGTFRTPSSRVTVGGRCSTGSGALCGMT